MGTARFGLLTPGGQRQSQKSSTLMQSQRTGPRPMERGWEEDVWVPAFVLSEHVIPSDSY